MIIKRKSFEPGRMASHATIAEQSRGRFYPEEDSPTRTHFQRDRGRIIHSTSFRRLNHKTQVFVYHEGDHYRTRLTHSIEVAQIARTLARALRVDEDLAEAVALAHDFGHTPFGHSGEEALNEVMHDFGGFDHNAQALRLVTELEHQYACFDGLNLSWECLEGLVKHNGPLEDEKDIHHSIIDFNELYNLELDRYSAIEAQCAAIADDIAYNAHDLDDGLRAGLFSPDDLKDIPLTGEILEQTRKLHPGLDNRRLAHEIVRRQIAFMVEDVIDQTMNKIEMIAPASTDDVRDAGETIVIFSRQTAACRAAINAFLGENMYQSPRVSIMRDNARIIIRDLFNAYFSGNTRMPDDWGGRWLEASGKIEEKTRARLVSDFLSGMTDKFAITEHRRLFDLTPDLS